MGIVKFRSKASAEIVMLKGHAEKLFSVMGLALESRGVVTAEQLPACIARLTAAMVEEKMAQEANPMSEDEEAALPKGMAAPVSLQQRGYPLLKMMQDAARLQVDVHWGF